MKAQPPAQAGQLLGEVAGWEAFVFISAVLPPTSAHIDTHRDTPRHMQILRLDVFPALGLSATRVLFIGCSI